jgi:hypothetical protein
MTIRPSLQLWQQGTFTCFITPSSEPGPYRVVIHDGDDLIDQHAFADHAAALAHAIEALGHAMDPTAAHIPPESSDNDPRR